MELSKSVGLSQFKILTRDCYNKLNNIYLFDAKIENTANEKEEIK